ncbi:hypothetical protein OSTOST_02835 [Ostertagia ostertagi]
MRRSTRPPRRAKKSDRSLRSTLRLFSMTSSDSEAEDDVYSLCVRDSPFCIDIALPEDRTSLRHISGFDNTGNVRIWPGGEALAYYLSIRPPLVSGKLVLELGAGLVGLPGFIAAIYATRVSVLKSADDVSEEFRMLGGEIEFDPDVVAHVSALVWDTVSDDWTSDLLEFSSKSSKQRIHKHSGVDKEDPMDDDMEFLGPIQAELLHTSTPLATKIEIQQTMRAEDGEPTAQSYRDSPSVRKAQNAPETVDATSIKTIHMELDNLLGKSQNIVGGSPKATTSKSPSPDLFNTPVKGILSEFDDDVKTSEPRHLTNSHQVPMSGEVTRIIDAGSKKSACGWSAKFSEFSFLDSIPTDASELKCTKEAPRKRTKQSSRELRHRSRDITSSKTPKHSSVATSKLDSARTSRSTGPSSSVRSTSSRTPQEKSIAASVPSSSSSLPKGSSSRLKSHPSKALHFTMDSDDDFFDL